MTGSGTLLDPYIIQNVTDLQNIELDLDAYYELEGNIDASATSTWNGGLGFNPISEFTGSFDGKGYSIISLTINRPLESHTGLFDTCTGATIKNLNISGGSITGYENVGALAGTAWGASVIDNCSSSANVTGYRQVGGLLGQVGHYWGFSEVNSITNSYSTGAVSVVTTYVLPRYIGGFVGWARATGGVFTDCYATGNISGSVNSIDDVGGFVGYVEEALTFTRCYATGNITLTGADVYGGNGSVGGFIGECWGGTYQQCYATGSVTINETSGYTPDSEGGGFAGEILGHVAVTIADCYARGAVTVAGQYAGGFVSYAAADNFGVTIDNCYSTGVVSGSSSVGGFCGNNLDAAPATITDCFWDTQTSGQATSDGGTGRTTAQMKTQSTFTNAGWNFTTIWDIDGVTNEGYPFLDPLTVTTDPATAIGGYIATLNGTLDADGGEVCACGFEWGETIAYGNTTPTQNRNAGQTFAQTVALLPNRTYHFRAFATNSVGTDYGGDRSFNTPQDVPSVQTDPATEIT